MTLFPNMNLFAGVTVVESPLCEMLVPVRKHKKRRSQSEKYHARIQKKWTKRWGTKKEMFAIFMNPGAVGLLGRPICALHPRDFAILRNIGSNAEVRRAP